MLRIGFAPLPVVPLLFLQIGCLSTLEVIGPSEHRIGADPFAGCESSAVKHGVVLRCPRAVLLVNEDADLSPVMGGWMILSGFRKKAEANGYRVDADSVELRLSGNTYPSLHYVMEKTDVMDKPDQSEHIARTGYLVVVPLEEEPGARAVNCIVPGNLDGIEERTILMLNELVHFGVPDKLQPKVPVIDGPPQMVGRALKVPAGCEVQESTQDKATLSCPGEHSTLASFTWRAIDSDNTEQSFSGFLKAVMDRQGHQKSEASPCLIAGEKAVCHHTQGSDDGGEYHIVTGFTKLEETSVFVMCLYYGQAIHPVCNDLFAEAPQPDE